MTVAIGKATATIVFSSPNYSYVKANGQKIYGSHTGSTSTFTIPVTLNANNTIIGMTTAMSTDHEVTYTIYIYIAAADDSDDDADADEDAPEVAGLTYESTDELDSAEGFSVYRYEQDIVIIVVHDVASYMVVPEDAALPVGASDGMILIQQPVDCAYVASDDVLALLADTEEDALISKILLVGCEEEDCTVEAIAARMAEDAVSYAGTYDAPSYADLLMGSCDLAVMPSIYADSAVLGTDAEIESELTEEDAEILLAVSDRLEMLEIPLFVDRSVDEETEEGRLEWIKAYGILMDCEDEANAAYDAAIAALSE